MAKRFFYISLGILALAVAWSLVAVSARASTDGDEHACVAVGDGLWWFSNSGEAFKLGTGGNWSREADHDLPVPPGQIRYLGNLGDQITLTGGQVSLILITNSNEFWAWGFVKPSVRMSRPERRWVKCDTFPGCRGTVPE